MINQFYLFIYLFIEDNIVLCIFESSPKLSSCNNFKENYFCHPTDSGARPTKWSKYPCPHLKPRMCKKRGGFPMHQEKHPHRHPTWKVYTFVAQTTDMSFDRSTFRGISGWRNLYIVKTPPDTPISSSSSTFKQTLQKNTIITTMMFPTRNQTIQEHQGNPIELNTK
jgi:hypothetical protein